MLDLDPQTGMGTVGAQETARLWLEYSVKGDPLNADVIVEVFQVTKVPDGGAHMRADLRRAVQR